MITISTHETYRLCKSLRNQYVKLTLVDGRSYKGYIADVDKHNVNLAVPDDGVMRNTDRGDERSFPFLWLTIPLILIAAAYRRRPRYPYPPYYTPPYAVAPYPPYPPYSPYPYYRK